MLAAKTAAGEQPGAARSNILQQKTTVIHGWDIVFNEKTTVIHGWDIKRLSPAYDFFKNNSSYIGKFQRMYVFPRQDSIPAKTAAGEQPGAARSSILQQKTT